MRWTALLLIVLLLSACSEEIVTEPDTSFRVTIEVVDGTGAPLPGMNVNVVNDVVVIPLVATSQKTSRANLTIPFTQPEEAMVRVFIEDVLGERVATLLTEIQSSGQYQVSWDGRSDDGLAMPAGLYSVRLVALLVDDNTILANERRDVFLLYMGDEYISGVTESDGSLTLVAESLFPGLMLLESLTATDDTGTVTGELQVLAGVTVYVWSASGGSIVQQSQELLTGPNTIQVVYDPLLAVANSSPVTPAIASVAKTGDKDEGVWELGNPYPNPFN